MLALEFADRSAQLAVTDRFTAFLINDQQADGLRGACAGDGEHLDEQPEMRIESICGLMPSAIRPLRHLRSWAAVMSATGLFNSAAGR